MKSRGLSFRKRNSIFANKEIVSNYAKVIFIPSIANENAGIISKEAILI